MSPPAALFKISAQTEPALKCCPAILSKHFLVVPSVKLASGLLQMVGAVGGENATGKATGALVGPLVGLFVGLLVGALTGEAVGALTGAVVGFFGGPFVGDFVRVLVGACSKTNVR